MRNRIDRRKDLVELLRSCRNLADAKRAHASIEGELGLGDVFLANSIVQAYGCCGSAADSRAVFDATRSKNTHSWIAMLAAYARNGHLDEAKRFFLGEMPEKSRDEAIACNIMIGVYSMAGEVDRAPDRTVVSYNTLIQAYARHGHMTDARALFVAMPERTAVSWNTLISTSGDLGDIRDTKSVFDRMPQWDAISWNAMIQANAACGHLDEASVLFRKMPERTEVSWTVMINGFVHGGEIDSAIAAFDRMPQWSSAAWNAMIPAYGRIDLDRAAEMFSVLPQRDVVSWNTVVKIHADAGYVDGAMALFHAMPQWNSVSCHALFHACRSVEESKHLYDAVPGHGIESCTAMLSAYAGAGQLVPARAVFEKMPAHSLVTWNALLTGHATHGHVDRALPFFAAMPEKDIISWNAAVEANGRDGRIDEARSAFNSMPGWDVASWTVMIVAESSNGRLDRAKSLFDSMPGRDVVVWNAMLAAYGSGPIDSAEKLFAAMPLWNIVSWNAMIQGYALAGRINEAQRTFESMPNGAGDLFALTAMVVANAAAGELDRSKALFDSSRHRHREVALWNAMVAAYRIAEARSVYDKMPEVSSVSEVTILTAYAHNGYLSAAKECFRSMHERNIVAETAMLAAYAQNGHLVGAREVFESMVVLSFASWNAMVTAYAQNGHSFEALELFHLMVLCGERPDGTTFSSVLLASSHGGVVERSRSYFVSMISDYSVSPGRDHFYCVVDAFGRAGRLVEAMELAAAMPFDADVVAWRSLLAACRISRDVESGGLIARKLFEIDPADSAAYIVLAGMHAAAGNTDEYSLKR